MTNSELLKKVEALEARVRELEAQLAAKNETHIHNHYYPAVTPQPTYPLPGTTWIGDPQPYRVGDFPSSGTFTVSGRTIQWP